MTRQETALLAVEALKKEYPGAVCSLTYQDPLQLLIATRLAAQCTDARVNMVTPSLFERFPTLDSFCEGTQEEIEGYIRSCGLFKTKARDIYAMCCMLRDEFGGIVPDTVEELTRLPGIGRKTANLVVGDIYHKPAVVTDTHCIRISGRLGLTDSTNPLKVENDLRAVLPPEESNDFCHRLVLHGRAVCDSRKPKCEDCCMQSFCRYVLSGGTIDPKNAKKKK
ncbi:MAG TPA: endonuclease III [Candidatus Gallacutalibacter pullistercoris]|nr:endonuclease III [Candidatus Gallacutalibacter pullistercoris]